MVFDFLSSFLFILNYFITSINNFKSLLDYLVSLKQSRSFYLYRANYIFQYTMKIYFQLIKLKAEII